MNVLDFAGITSFFIRRSNEQLYISARKNIWEDRNRQEELQEDYHTERRYPRRARIDWRYHNEQEKRVFRDT